MPQRDLRNAPDPQKCPQCPFSKGASPIQKLSRGQGAFLRFRGISEGQGALEDFLRGIGCILILDLTQESDVSLSITLDEPGPRQSSRLFMKFSIIRSFSMKIDREIWINDSRQISCRLNWRAVILGLCKDGTAATHRDHPSPSIWGDQNFFGIIYFSFNFLSSRLPAVAILQQLGKFALDSSLPTVRDTIKLRNHECRNVAEVTVVPRCCNRAAAGLLTFYSSLSTSTDQTIFEI